MESKLIIGCKHCENTLKDTKGFSFAKNGELQLPISVYTAFTTNEELNNLFTDHYTCPFCDSCLEITPRMMKYVTSFFDKSFHIDITYNFIEISNGELSFAVPIEKEINSVLEFLAESGVILENADNHLPTTEDIKCIQSAVKEYDRTQWKFRIESGNALEPYISSYGLWFNDIE